MHLDFTPTQVDIERFWSKVDTSDIDGCWPYLGARTVKGSFGYGAFSFRVSKGVWKHIVGSRFAWHISFGPIPEGMKVLHECDNPSCCNPSHLVLGTQADNMEDMKRKGRQRRGESSRTPRLTESDVLQIRERFALAEASVTELAAEFGISDRSMRDVVYVRSWKHV